MVGNRGKVSRPTMVPQRCRRVPTAPGYQHAAARPLHPPAISLLVWPVCSWDPRWPPPPPLRSPRLSPRQKGRWWRSAADRMQLEGLMYQCYKTCPFRHLPSFCSLEPPPTWSWTLGAVSPPLSHLARRPPQDSPGRAPFFLWLHQGTWCHPRWFPAPLDPHRLNAVGKGLPPRGSGHWERSRLLASLPIWPAHLPLLPHIPRHKLVPPRQYSPIHPPFPGDDGRKEGPDHGRGRAGEPQVA
mmetsp:Transcript_7476/g.18278  ORF Transcript_7476/g.18278 Transcript_7476/m.18278 type:complete len:242 (+) Transcript_7476:572-1297(+)